MAWTTLASLVFLLLAIAIEVGNYWIYTRTRSSGILLFSILASLASAGMAEWEPVALWVGVVCVMTAISFGMPFIVIRLGKSFRQNHPS